MQREILRREKWKRFLIQLQPSDAASDSLAAMIFSWPPDLRWRLAYVLTGVARSDSSVSGTTERLTRTRKGLALELAAE